MAFQPKYIVDTSSLLELRDRYPRELAPGAWDLIEKLIEGKVVASVEDVLEELAVGDDDLLKWAKERADVFIPLYDDIQARAKAILAAYPDLIDTKSRKSSADPFVIATAELTGAAVVTEENLAGQNHRVKIPNVCRARAIPCMRLRELFIAEGLVLVAR